MMRFEIPGAVVEFRGFDLARSRRIAAAFDPYPDAQQSDEPDVVIEAEAASAPTFDDIQNTAGDTRVTASAGQSLHVVVGDRVCRLPDFAEQPPFRFKCDASFPLGTLLRTLIRPTVQIAVARNGRVAVHGSCIEWQGRGLIVAGWSESGKTETALAFMEGGARFVSDKWTIVDSRGALEPFPISVGIRRFVLPNLPRLRRALPARARAQLAAAAVASAVTQPVRRRSGSWRIGAITATFLDRAVALGERAALTPSQLSRAYGEQRPLMRTDLSTIVLLTTVPDSRVRVDRADPEWAARRLARSAAYERRPFYDVDRRARYAFPSRTADLERETERTEELFLTKVLADKVVLEARASFPTDPRAVASAIEARLE